MKLQYSNFVPRADLLQSLPGSLEQRLEPLREKLPDGFVAFHNHFVDYCLALLMIATGHRPIIDPFCGFNDVDLEQGICLISDKVLYESRAWRVVALPPLAVKQFSAYREHLSVLASQIALNHPNHSVLAFAIQENLKGGKNSPPIPQFFYLDHALKHTLSVMPRRLKERWGSAWPWPSIYGRHVLASVPGDDAYPGHLISAHLGHSQGPDHPLGRLSVLSLDELLARQTTEAEKVLRGFGWRALEGLRYTPDLPQVIARPKDMPTWVHELRLLGPDRRRQGRLERDTERLRCARLVRDAILAAAGGDDLPSPLPVDLRARITAEIAQRAAAIGRPSEPFMRLANRALSRINQEKNQASFSIDLEPSPFCENTLNDFRSLRRLRRAFLEYLDQSGREDCRPTSERRFSELVLAAALWGGRKPLARFKEFAAALIDRCYTLGGLAWVELVPEDEDQKQSVRWWPDPVSLSLLIALARDGNIEALKGLSENTLSQALGSLLRQLGESTRRAVDRRRLLAQLAATANLLEQKGFVRAMEGEAVDISSTPLPLPTLVRVMTGKRVVPQRDGLGMPAADFDEEGSLKVFSAARKRGTRFRKPHDGVPMWAALCRYLRETEKVPAKGVARRHSVRRRALAKAIIQGLGKGQVSGSTIESLVADWTLHLCQEGTRRKSKLSFRTVKKYARMVGNPLVDLARAQDFLSLTDVEFEEIYLQSLDFTTEKERPTLVGRLREFHLFLASQAGVDEPEWSVLYRAAGAPRRDIVDASFVTNAEYRAVLRALLKLPNVPLLMRHQYAFLVFLGYRFGLRFGEALRLRLVDISATKDNKIIWVQIKNNIFGQTKTAAGVRQIPLLGVLTDLEREIFSGIMAAAEAKSTTDLQTALVSSEADPRELVDRYTASRYIHACLRGITGDCDLRFHHLRHSWATRAFSIAFQAEADGPFSPWFELAPMLGYQAGLCENAGLVWGNTEPDGQALKAIAASIGHVSEGTTLETYIHAVDIYAASARWKKAPALSDYAAAYALGLGYQATRRRRVRLGANRGDINAIVVSEKCDKWFRAPPVETTRARWKPDEVSASEDPLTPLKVARLLWLTARRGGVGTGVSEAVGISEESARNVLNAARELERLTGYDRYSAYASSPDLLHRSRTDHKAASYLDKRSAIRRLRALLQQAEIIFSQISNTARDRFFAGLKAWAVSYDAPRGRAYFTSMEELELFLETVKLLYPNGVTWATKTPRENGLDPEVVVRLQALGCSVESDSERVPHAREKSRFLAATRLEVRAKVDNPKIGNAPTLYRALLILAVWEAATFDKKVASRI